MRNPQHDRTSLIAFIVCMLVLTVMRVTSLTANELSWDAFGYYLYLPATFIHDDPLLHDPSWAYGVMEQYGTTGTLYQLTTAPDNSTPMYFFLMGMAICYLPSFLLGHSIAWFSGAPMDGFSMPYQVTMALGALAYTGIGLWNLRRVLRRFVPDRDAAITLLVIVLGTNLLQFATAKNLETANFLFCMVAVMVWNTMRWHEDQRRSNLMWIAGSIALITLIKPSEIVCGLVPMLWGVYDAASLRSKLALLRTHAKDLLLAVLLGLVVLAPQLLYWYSLTGSFIYDSYRNPGVGLDLLRPHILDSLFSFRKGWLVYTPVMWAALVGFIPLFRQKRSVFWAITMYVTVGFYILASWSEWWYGASYSIRPMVSLYPVLAIPLALTVQAVGAWGGIRRSVVSAAFALLVVLNCFQLWQFRNWIIHPYRTTKDYYLTVFGRTSVPAGAERLLSADWSFDGTERMGPEEEYARGPMVVLDKPGKQVLDTLTGRSGFVLDRSDPYGPTWEIPYAGIAGSEYVWVKARAAIRSAEGPPPCLVFNMERKEGSYGYRTVCLPDSGERGWVHLEGTYMTPPIRDVNDRLKVYLWHRDGGPILVDSMLVETFIPR